MSLAPTHRSELSQAPAPAAEAAIAVMVAAFSSLGLFLDAGLDAEACVLAQLRRTAPADADIVRYLASLHGNDFVLAAAVAAGSRSAAAALQHAHAGTVRRALQSARVQDAVAADVGQRIWERVLVGSDRQPASIATYSGRGALGAWIHVSVVREAHLTEKHSARFTSDATLEEVLKTEGDGELEYMKRLYVAEFRAAFRAALAALAALRAPHRALLRYTYVDGLSADRLAVHYGVHRVSIARRLAAARAALAIETRRILARQLGLEEGDSDSVMRLINSRLDVSLSALHSDP